MKLFIQVIFLKLVTSSSNWSGMQHSDLLYFSAFLHISDYRPLISDRINTEKNHKERWKQLHDAVLFSDERAHQLKLERQISGTRTAAAFSFASVISSWFQRSQLKESQTNNIKSVSPFSLKRLIPNANDVYRHSWLCQCLSCTLHTPSYSASPSPTNLHTPTLPFQCQTHVLTPLAVSGLHLFKDSVLKKQIFAYFWDWHHFMFHWVFQRWPKFSTEFFESWNDATIEIMGYSQDSMGLKASKHLFVIQPLTSLPPAYVPYFTLLLHLPPYGLVFNAPSRDACTDGPAAACSPSGSSWHGRLFGPLPLPSSPVTTGAQE